MTTTFHKVAVVDDDPRVRKLIGLSLGELGVDADFYDEPFEFLRVVSDSSPKLVLIDLMMPQMDGVECCRRLRQMGCTAYLCIVSALYDDQMVRDALSAGANRYLGKSEVFEILDELLKASDCFSAS
ncbi:response regulator [Synechococcus sp. BA-124 BA4]|jgi:DNA-binding response OmpR family regulator|uniref:response regulator n=1 Tax=Synechococcus sp. BA-124 BA4 TaxID=3110251 RepID=UPI002B200167|nr:response regulator [Synechococcus sp. BA-124 BA4]MEA5399593.1 response regulator [Synechococcus sp. BA-124 BA4]MEA5413028.1 response regulator [Synechococcus sp. BA-120 BA3]